MDRRRELDYVQTPTASTLLDAAREGADRRVWRLVAQRMQHIAAADSIAYRIGSVGRGWRAAVWIIAGTRLAARMFAFTGRTVLRRRHAAGTSADRQALLVAVHDPRRR